MSQDQVTLNQIVVKEYLRAQAIETLQETCSLLCLHLLRIREVKMQILDTSYRLSQQ